MRKPVSEIAQDAAFEVIYTNLDRKIKKHGPGAYYSPHETLGIITEEYWELIEAIKRNHESDVISELADVAVGCIFGIASILNKEKD